MCNENTENSEEDTNDKDKKKPIETGQDALDQLKGVEKAQKIIGMGKGIQINLLII